MAAPHPSPRPVLSDAEWQAVEDRVGPFEDEWAAGRRPRIADFLDGGDSSGGRVLVELVLTDLEYRLKAGEFVRVESYLAEHPQLSGLPGAVDELAAAEYRLRKRAEPALTSATIRRRLAAGTATAFAGGGDTVRDERGSGRGEKNGRPFDVVPGYEVVGELGRGGMGVVYEAVETRLKRTVALKTLRPGAEADERDRLRREAEAAASLVHPNVVPVHAVFDHAGRLYVASEYLPGGTLADRVAAGPLDSKDAAAALEPIARAVAYAHSRGIVHRDLKPANVLLAADGTPKVADFGLAKRLGDDSEPTRTGVIAGSPSYMAPEQAAGSKKVGPAADVWALGAVLYELLTGRPPFRGATALQTLGLVRGQDPVSPRRLVPAVKRDLETVCLKCLEKEPGKRYPSAAALADDLGRFRRGEAVVARPVGRVGVASRWAKRHPAVATLSALLVMSLVAGSGVSLWLAARATAGERYSRRLTFASDMTSAAEAIRAGDPSRAADLLAEHEAERDGRYAFVWNHLDRLVRCPGTVVDRLAGAAYFACFSPDGKTLAVCREGGEIRLYRADTWTPTGRIAAGQGELNGLAFSPDGRRLASAGDDGTVVLWDVRSRKRLWRKKLFDEPAYQVAFGLGGTVLACCGNVPEVRLLAAESGEEVASWVADTRDVESLAVTSDGRTLLTAGYGGRGAAWNLEDRRELWRQEVDPKMNRLKSAAVSPDDRFAAFGTANAELLVVDVPSGNIVHSGRLPLTRSDRTGADVRSVVFTAADELAIGTDAGVVHLVGVSATGLAPLTDRARVAWQAHGDRVYGMACTTDGPILTTARDGTVAAWRPRSEAAWRSAPASFHAPGVAPLVTSAVRGETFVVARRNEVVLIGADDGREETLITERGRWGKLLLSADGRWLFAGSGSGRLIAWRLGGGRAERGWSRELGPRCDVLPAAVPADGSFLVVKVNVRQEEAPDSKQDFRVAVHSAVTGEPIVSRDVPAWPCDPAVSPDGRIVATSQGELVCLLNPKTLATVSAFPGHERKVECVAFSPDGRRLASGGEDQRVIVWDVRTGEQVRAWRADTGSVERVLFSADGETLLTGSPDHPPRLWDVETGRLLLEPGSLPHDARGGHGYWSSLSFTRDGGRITAGGDGVGAVLDGRPMGTASDADVNHERP